MAEARLTFGEAPFGWRAGTKQHLLGSDYVLYDSTAKVDAQPSTVEFEIVSNQVALFGPMTKFQVTGTFESKTSATEGDWTPATDADKDKVVVQPNWFGHLIKEVAVFYGNHKLCTSDEAQYIAPFLDTYLYAQMDPLAKKLLCPQLNHPGNGVPVNDKEWTFEAAGKEWYAYAPNIFTGKSIVFDYIPLHLFPFFQRANYLIDNNWPSPLPVPALGKLIVRFTFVDTFNKIFKKKTGNAKLYRFTFDNIQLLVEEARLPLAYEKQFLSRKNAFYYSGVTKAMIAETIVGDSLQYRTRFQNVPFPEGLFIFCLDKKCLAGTYDYQDAPDTKVFMNHNIDKVYLTYNGQSFYTREPNTSQTLNEFMQVKQLMDHLAAPPFGMTQDPKKLSLPGIENGGNDTPYPHVYINLCNFGDKSRLVPLLNDGSLLSNNHDLDLQLTFLPAGARGNANYIFYLYYTDTNQVLDMRTKKFFSPYFDK